MTTSITPGDMDPTPNNQSSKTVARLLALVIAAQFLLSANITYAGEPTARELLDCVNAIRTGHGVAQNLAVNEKLDAAAALKLEDMKKYDYWRHENPVTKKKPWDFVDSAGYPYSITGENLALGYLTSTEICSAWENSSLHLANIKQPGFQDVGIALDKTELKDQGKGILVVMLFGAQRGLADTASDKQKYFAGNNTNNLLESSSELKNTIVFVIVFSYALTIIILLFNYIARRKRKWSKVMGGVALVLAVSSIVLTMILFAVNS